MSHRNCSFTDYGNYLKTIQAMQSQYCCAQGVATGTCSCKSFGVESVGFSPNGPATLAEIGYLSHNYNPFDPDWTQLHGELHFHKMDAQGNAIDFSSLEEGDFLLQERDDLGLGTNYLLFEVSWHGQHPDPGEEHNYIIHGTTLVGCGGVNIGAYPGYKVTTKLISHESASIILYLHNIN